MLFWPGQHPSAAAATTVAGDALVAAVIRALGPVDIGADPSLLAPGVYSVPEQWAHVAAALHRAGFDPGHRTELVLVADVADLPRGGPAPVLPRGRCFHEVQSDLTVGGADRVLSYSVPGEHDDEIAFLRAMGWREPTRTRRGRVRRSLPR